jgi:hypothetical protein
MQRNDLKALLGQLRLHGLAIEWRMDRVPRLRMCELKIQLWPSRQADSGAA